MNNIALQNLRESIESGEFTAHTAAAYTNRTGIVCGCFLDHMVPLKTPEWTQVHDALTAEMNRRFNPPNLTGDDAYGDYFSESYLSRNGVTKDVALDIINAAIQNLRE